jgi:hypothetical protein
MRSDAPTKGDMGCVWPRQESRSPTVTTKTKVGNKGCLYNKIINKCGKDVQNTETGAPVVNECPRGGINVVKTDEGWGDPLASFCMR